MTHLAIGPDAAGRWHVARCLPGCPPTGVMDCLTAAIAQREAEILDGVTRSVPRMTEREMYWADVMAQRELDENYGMPRADSPFAQTEIPF